MSATLSFAPGGETDLANPGHRPVDFEIIARRLARLLRFSGDPGALSVAQHSVMGADAIIEEGGSPTAAVLFLHHDDQEALLGDLIAPVYALLAGQLPGFADKWHAIKANWDNQIYRAARLPTPDSWTRHEAALVKSMDRRMQAAESLALYGPASVRRFSPSERRTPKFRTGLKNSLSKCWPPSLAEEAWLDAHKRFTGRNLI